MTATRISYTMTAPGMPLARAEVPLHEPAPGEVAVQVAGCGVCHTDISFYSGAVRTRRDPPLVLGHEVAGTVVAAGKGCEALAGARVVVPAVLPCGDCVLCQGGRANACQSQKMPGNDIDGGFSTHMYVPGRSVVRVDGPLGDLDLWELSVVADAVSTPYQALLRAGVREGDVAIFVGLGGIGGFGVQLAAAMGARVFGVDVDPARIGRLADFGLLRGLDARQLDGKTIRKEIAAYCREQGLPPIGWKVFETSGTRAGQETAFGLLTHTGTLGVVGFSPEPVTVRLSNLMAFDATAFGNWGCDPAHYPAVIDLVRAGKVRIRPFVQRFPLDEAGSVLETVAGHGLTERAVLVP